LTHHGFAVLIILSPERSRQMGASKLNGEAGIAEAKHRQQGTDHERLEVFA
jgi:hypothetical protein